MAPSTTIPGFYTVAEAAEKIGVDPSQVSRYISAGLLEPVDLGKQWLIPADQVEGFERPKVGNPNFQK